MGKTEAARAIEPLCMLWRMPGFLRNDWVHAFKLLGGNGQQTGVHHFPPGRLL